LVIVDSSLPVVLLSAGIGLVVSFGLEAGLHPRPALPWLRPFSCNALHAGLWIMAHGMLVLLLGRPWFTMIALSAFLLLLVLVNNAKEQALREPFVFQDFEYFTDAMRHPRLYIPFLGWGKTLVAGCGFATAVVVGLGLESTPPDRWMFSGQLGGVLLLLLMGVALFVHGVRALPPPAFQPDLDIRKLGLLSSLWAYARAEQTAPLLASPFDLIPVPQDGMELPHIVAVQSESFFDPRPWFPGVRTDVLSGFDKLRAAAVRYGALDVPAWGANTVRSEFAFLSGIAESKLGVHRFNPYRKAVQPGMATLAGYLKRLGYRTICVHPYPASFYERDRIYPMLGFDQFIDIDGFKTAQHAGPFIGDAAVTEKIRQILDKAEVPLFVFVITMENHGPLHLESVSSGDMEKYFDQFPPADCADLAVYLRHLRNADRMIEGLADMLANDPLPAWLCWYGDHVPIMSKVYRTLGIPQANTEYVIWHNRPGAAPEIGGMAIHELASKLVHKAFCADTHPQAQDNICTQS
jgi:hypothetical protein